VRFASCVAWSSLLIAGAIFSCVGSLSGRGEKYNDPGTTCPGNLWRLGEGLVLYSSAFDDQLPTQKWMDQSTDAGAPQFPTTCPALASQGQRYGYAIRDAVLGAKLSGIGADKEVLLFDTSLSGRNAVGTLRDVPSPKRHYEGNYVLYEDLSAKPFP